MTYLKCFFIMTILACAKFLGHYANSGVNFSSTGYYYVQHIDGSGYPHVSRTYVLNNSLIFHESQSFRSPLEISSSNENLIIDLEVKPFRVSNELFSFNTRAFCYENVCSVPGPTISVKQGQVLINLSEKINRTSFYIHGFMDNSDIINYNLLNSSTIQYTIRIPTDCSLGSYWYSSNIMGATALQTMGGLVGVFRVLPSETFQGHSVSSLTRSMNILLLTHIMLDKSSDGDILEDDVFSSSLSFTKLSKIFGSSIPIEPRYKSSIHDAWFTNGLYQPTIELNLGSVYMFEIVVASSDRILEIEIKNVVNDRSCDITLLAIDNVYLTNSRTIQRIFISQAGRVAIAVNCNTIGVYVLGTYSELDFSEQFYQVGDYESKSIQPLLIMNVTENSISDSVYNSTELLNVTSLPFPPYLMPIKPLELLRLGKLPVLSLNFEQTGANRFSYSFSSSYDQLQFWIGIGSNCKQPEDCFDDVHCQAFYGVNFSATDFPTSRENYCYYRNALLLESNNTFNIVINETNLFVVEVWTREKFQYPFSIQGYHLQLIEYIPQSNTRNDLRNKFGYEYFEWRDSWVALPGKMKFLSRYNGIRSTVIRSNFLKYYDRGMVTPVNISFSNTLSPNKTTSTQSGSNSSASIDTDVIKKIPCDPFGNSFFFEESLDHVNRIRLLKTSLCPNHYSLCQESFCGNNITLAYSEYSEIEIPLYPMIQSLRIDRTCSSTIVGYAINGVPIFGPSDGVTKECGTPRQYGIASEGRIACDLNGDGDGSLFCGDIVKSRASIIDACGGFSRNGIYGYNTVPTCLLLQLIGQSLTRASSPQIGWAIDGFPIYGPIGPRGIRMMRCGEPEAHLQLCLDQCNGYYGRLKNYDDYVYRYYITGLSGSGECDEVVRINNTTQKCNRTSFPCCSSHLPGPTYFPYTIGCIVGCIPGSEKCSVKGRGYGPDFIPKISGYPTSIYNATLSNPLPRSDILESKSIAINSAIQSTIVNRSVAPERERVTSKSYESYFLSKNPFNGTFRIIPIPNDPNIDDAPSIIELPLTEKDFYITSQSLSSRNDEILLGTSTGVYLFYPGSNELKCLIDGMILVQLEGFNLGKTSSQNILSISISGSECTSISRINSSFVTCFLRQKFDSIPSSDSVIIYTTGGSTQGLTRESETAYRQSTGRPILSVVKFLDLPFYPYAVSFVESISIGDSHSEDFIYFSNDGSLTKNNNFIGSVSRCLRNGTNIEHVVPHTGRRIRSFKVLKLGDNMASNIVLMLSSCGAFSVVLIPLQALEQNESYSNRIPIDILVGLEYPTSLTIDYFEMGVYIACVDGIVLRVDLATIISIARGQFYSQLPLEFDFEDIVKNDSTLPSWINLVTSLPSMSRILCLESLRYESFTSKISLGGSLQPERNYKEQRLIIVDTNQHSIYFYSAERKSRASINFGNSFGDNNVLFPSAVSVVVSSSYTGNNITLYVAEYFGKLWKISIATDSYGVLNRDIESVNLLIDKSEFTSSIEIRRIVNSAKTVGVALYKILFFEPSF